jgi:hypothetical protein
VAERDWGYKPITSTITKRDRGCSAELKVVRCKARSGKVCPWTPIGERGGSYLTVLLPPAPQAESSRGRPQPTPENGVGCLTRWRFMADCAREFRPSLHRVTHALHPSNQVRRNALGRGAGCQIRCQRFASSTHWSCPHQANLGFRRHANLTMSRRCRSCSGSAHTFPSSEYVAHV